MSNVMAEVIKGETFDLQGKPIYQFYEVRVYDDFGDMSILIDSVQEGIEIISNPKELVSRIQEENADAADGLLERMLDKGEYSAHERVFKMPEGVM